MDTSGIGSLNTAMSAEQTSMAVSTAVLKKAIDIEAQNSMQLLQALPPTYSNPPNLGNSVDVKA